MKLALCVAGAKGQHFLESLAAPVEIVISYEQKNVIDDAFPAIRQWCRKNKIRFIDAKRPKLSELAFDLCFVVGWQYLLAEPDDRVVIFHDSLLPKYRGYSPTVAAIMAGDRRIGVSAILPSEAFDAGPILDQEAVEITYPILMRDVLDKLAGCYIRIAERLLKAAQKQKLATLARPQDEKAATYSLWRGDDDQWINWNDSSERIERLVNALTWPYTGARARYLEKEIIIHAVSVEPDLPFSERHPGKIWALANSQPIVVCGSGLLRVVKATTPGSKPVIFSRLRSHFTSKA